MMEAVGAVKLLINVAMKAKQFHKFYGKRDGELKTFADYMWSVGVALEGMQGQITDRAVPILQQIITKLEEGHTLLAQYNKKWKMKAMYDAKDELQEIDRLQKHIMNLLIPLELVTHGNNAAQMQHSMHAYFSHLQKVQKEESNAAVKQHLQIMHEYGHKIAQAATAKDVDVAMRQIMDSQMALSQEGFDRVVSVNQSMQATLADGFGAMSEKLHNVHRAQESLASAMNRQNSARQQDVEIIMKEFAELKGMVANMAEVKEHKASFAAALRQAKMNIPESDQPNGATARFTSAAHMVMAAVKNGDCKGCPVEGTPYTPSGPLRPVTLNECQCTMSALAAKSSAAARKCKLCHKPLRTDTGFSEDEKVGRVSEAEAFGMCMPEIDAERLAKKDFITRGGEGEVWKGEYEGHGPVAIKVVPMVGQMGKRDRTQVMTMLSSTYLASTSTPLVCKFYGVCWREQEVWLVMELCAESSVRLVDRAREDLQAEGLPPIDVVVLALEVAEALSGLHDRARTMHLDLKPDNILLTSSSEVRLTDFGISSRLPKRLSRFTVNQVAEGTLGYAAPEQMQYRNGSPKSDIYSLGATIIYFATGDNPYNDANDRNFILTQFTMGNPMDVSPSVEPLELNELVKSMVALDRDARPSLHAVRSQLHTIVHSLVQQGQRPKYVKPVYGITSFAPPPPLNPPKASPPAAGPYTAPNGPVFVPSDTVYGGNDVKQALSTPHPAAQRKPSMSPEIQNAHSANWSVGDHSQDPSLLLPKTHSNLLDSPFDRGQGADRQQSAPAPATPAQHPYPAPLHYSPCMPPQRVPSADGQQQSAQYPSPYGPTPYRQGNPQSTPQQGANPYRSSSTGNSSAGDAAHPHGAPNTAPNIPYANNPYAAQPTGAGPMPQPVLPQQPKPKKGQLAVIEEKLQRLQDSGLSAMRQVLNKGSLVVLFQHVNTVLCGGKMDLQGQSFCIPEKKGVLGRSSGNPNKELQSLPEMNAYVAAQAVPNAVKDAERPWRAVGASSSAKQFALHYPSTVLENGRLVFPPGTYFVLNSQCYGVAFKRCTFSGAPIVCHGQNCSVKFEDCVLEGCPLVISEGSNVTLSNTNCSSTGCAIMAKGAGTKLTVNLGTFSQVHQAVCVEEGAHACLTSLTASGFTSAGIEARDVNSHLTLSRCNVSNGCPTGETLASLGLRPDFAVAAVWVHGGARCDAHECMLGGCTVGVGVEDPQSSLQATGCRLCDNRRSGLAARGGATAALKQCTSGSNRSVQVTGVESGGAGTCVNLLSCNIHRNSSCGVMAYSNTSVIASGCVSDSNNIGYYVLSTAVAKLSRCQSKGETPYSEQGGTVTRSPDCVPR